MLWAQAQEMAAELNWKSTKLLLAIVKELNGAKDMLFFIFWYFIKTDEVPFKVVRMIKIQTIWMN